MLSMLDSPVQAAPYQLASGAQLTSCTAWRQGAVAQVVQILKQTPEGSCRCLLDSPVQAAPSQVASGAQLTSCTAWRLSAVAQVVQILKQTPEGSRWGPLDSPEHTDFSLWLPGSPTCLPQDLEMWCCHSG